MIDPDLMQGTGERQWQPTPGLSRHAIRRRPSDGSWVPHGVIHAVDSQHRDALCGTPCPFKWGEWPASEGEICPACLALAPGSSGVVDEDFGRKVLDVMADGVPSTGDNLLGMELDFLYRLAELDEIDPESVEVNRTGSAECLIRATCFAAAGVGLAEAARGVTREWLANLRYKHSEAHRVREIADGVAVEFVTQMGPGGLYVTGRVEIGPGDV